MAVGTPILSYTYRWGRGLSRSVESVFGENRIVCANPKLETVEITSLPHVLVRAAGNLGVSRGFGGSGDPRGVSSGRVVRRRGSGVVAWRRRRVRERRDYRHDAAWDQYMWLFVLLFNTAIGFLDLIHDA